MTTGAYVINCVAPTFTPVAGTYTGTQSVTISSVTGGVSIRYTTDGSTPTPTTGTVYSGAVSVPVNLTLNAIAYETGMGNSSATRRIYHPGWSKLEPGGRLLDIVEPQHR